jgi:biotin-[acetyl-CoA-carboxylase] ligase BirA-like protein
MLRLDEMTSKWGQQSKVRLHHEVTTTSTFDDAKQNFLVDQDTSLTLYTADHQTSGRGRGGRTWDDTDGGSFLSTWSFKVSQPPQPILAPLVGLGVYSSVRETWTTAKVSLKAPNDILLDGKKAAGILIENIQQGTALRCLIGLGVNVYDKPQGDYEATSLSETVDSITEDHWIIFMNALKWNLEQALVDGVLQHLSQSLREKLLAALNANPNLDKPYKDVLADGSLRQSDDSIVPWMSL